MSHCSGGIRLTVEGTHLDSVVRPAMRLRINYTESNSPVYTDYAVGT